MTDLPSSLQKIQTESVRFRSAVSESVAQTLGGSINALIDKNSVVGGTQTFLTSGVCTIPINVSVIEVKIWAGGGGGGGNNGGPSGQGGCGGGGAAAVSRIFAVTPGSTHAVTIGAGGSGAVVSVAYGQPGGNSSFGSLLTARGAQPGTHSSVSLTSNSGPSEGRVGVPGSGSCGGGVGGWSGQYGGNSVGVGGAPGQIFGDGPGRTVWQSGGGGGAGEGNGGTGGSTSGGSGSSASANSGGGGGGGGVTNPLGTFGSGGAGGSGGCIVTYIW